MERTPSLSVVIPTLGRPILIQTVKSLVAAQGFDRLEVIVAGRIADGSVLDGLGQLCSQHPQIRHLSVAFKKGDSSEKKNAGFRASRADIVAFLDDDVVVAPDWPLRIVEPFADPRVGFVSGPSLVPDDLPLMGRLAGVVLASKAAGYVSERYLAGASGPREAKWSRLIGCNMAYRRTVLESIGLFDPAFWPGEEMIAAYRATQAGHKLVFHPEATLHHYPRASLGRFVKQIYGYGATRVRLFRAGVEFEPTTIVPAVWVLSLVLLGVGCLLPLFVRAALPWLGGALGGDGGASPFFRWCLGLLGLDLALYALADAAIALAKFMETRRAVDLLIVFLIPVMHLTYGIAEWVELFRPGKDLSEGG